MSLGALCSSFVPSIPIDEEYNLSALSETCRENSPNNADAGIELFRIWNDRETWMSHCAMNGVKLNTVGAARISAA